VLRRPTQTGKIARTFNEVYQMKALLFAAAAALTVALSAPAFAATDGTSAQAPQTVAPPVATGATGTQVAAAKGPADPNQIICKTVDVTGSHLGAKRTCRTRAVWEEITRASREQTENIQNSDTGTNIPHF
jgi:hypothetical protein